MLKLINKCWHGLQLNGGKDYKSAPAMVYFASSVNTFCENLRDQRETKIIFPQITQICANNKN